MNTLKTNNITLYGFLNSIKNCETVSASIAAIGGVSWKAHEIYEAIKKEVLRHEVVLVSYNFQKPGEKKIHGGCPNCKSLLYKEHASKYCGGCGQHIAW